MALYLIGAIDRHDVEKYKCYEEAAFVTVGEHCVEPLAVSDNVEVIEGFSPAKRMILMRFESREAFDKWYNSESYQKAKQIRLVSSDTKFLVCLESIG